MKREKPLPPEPWLPDVKAPRVWLLVRRADAAQLAAGTVPPAVRVQASVCLTHFTDWVAQCQTPPKKRAATRRA